MWTAMIGIDLLNKVILKLRPFAKDAKAVQKIYETSLKRWIETIESRCNMRQMRRVMSDIADEFAVVELDHTVQKPTIGIVGEIYVRSHPFANMNIISRLEKLGAACELASLAEWIYYTNFTRGRRVKRTSNICGFLTNALQNHLQHKIERDLAKPLEARFGKLVDGSIEHVIALSDPYIHQSFEGEAILSAGKMVEYHHQGFGGVINVMPFSCMPSTVVSTQTMRISADCGNMPILNLSFDGQEDATLTTRLEAFVEQVRQNQQANLTAAQVISIR